MMKKGFRTKRSTSKRFLTIVFLTCCLGIASFAAVPVHAFHSANSMWIDPSVLGVNFSVGTRFNVTVWVNLNQTSFSWQVGLRFNTTYLNATQAGFTGVLNQQSDFFSGHSSFPASLIDDSGGGVYLTETLVGSDFRPAGNGSLCWVEFQVVASTERTTLSLDQADSFVLDPDLNLVQLTRFDAEVLNTGQAGSHPAEAMWIDPSDFNVSFTVGTRFNVTAWANISQPTLAWQFYLRFDTACLNATRGGFTAGITSDFFRGHLTFTLPWFADNVQGIVVSGETLLDPDFRPAGSGSLYWVEFEVTASADQTTLYLQNDQTFCLDPDVNYISVTPYAAVVRNGLPPIPTLMFVDPSVSTVGLNMNFTVNVDVSMVSDLYNWEAKIYYDKTLLNYTGSAEGGFLSSGGTTLWLCNSYPDYNSTHGMVYFGGSLLGYISGVTGNGTLASISFQAFGNSTFALSEAMLLDSQLSDIAFETQGGSVVTGNENLVVSAVSPDKRVVCQNQPLNVTVTAENLGTSTQTFNVTLYLNSTAIDQQQIIGLAPNSSFTYTYTWNASTFEPGAYLLSATADRVLGETNYDDNTLVNGTLYVEIIGDIAGKTGVPDGRVDMRDIGLIARAFGTKIGDTYYSPECDLNGDGIINMRDIGLAAKHFGEHYP